MAAQDPTEINFVAREERRPGLGPAGDGVSAGFFLHPVIIAIDSKTEAVLGLLDAQIWTRSEEFDATPARAADRLTDAASVVVVADRESDICRVRPASGIDRSDRPCRAGWYSG